MENELKELVQANSEANRATWAREWKQGGGKVIGTLCSYVPEEVIQAAGMLPWRVSGTWRENVPRALAYRPVNSCPYCTHVLETVLSGELDFLDGVITTSRDQDVIRLVDVWRSLGKTMLTAYMYLPHHDSRLARQQFAREIRKLARSLEEFSRVSITEESLSQAIAENIKTRRLLTRVYELRKRPVPPLSGAETLGIVTANTIMPKDRFNKKLEAILPYLEKRQAPVKRTRPRLLVSGDLLDNTAYLDLIEGLGCVICMDDLDTGSRYFWGEVKPFQNDLFEALSNGYLDRPAGPHMYSWQKQLAQVIQWVRDFDVDGVIELVLISSQSRQMRKPFFRDTLQKAGIRNISLTREYHLANVGQLSTRVQAFLEMVQS
jgi:benzoyl-CoA reductase subunit C